MRSTKNKLLTAHWHRVLGSVYSI